MTLIHASNPGKWERRCDATCHRARKPKCDCICGGRYHGRDLIPGALTAAIAETALEMLSHLEYLAAHEGVIIHTNNLRGTDQLILPLHR